MNMRGKVCLVTGANAGIGGATAMGLARRDATVFLVCRNRARGEDAKAQILQATGNTSVHLLIADLSSQSSIRALAAEFRERSERLHVLINNAGIITKNRMATKDRLEMQLAVNHLAPFLITHLLLGTLTKSAPARIINLASEAHKGHSIDFDDLQSQASYSHTRTYGRTKLANVLFAYELARRLKGTNVTANCLHPGVIGTKLLNDYLGTPQPLRFVAKSVFGSLEKGADTSLYLATEPAPGQVSGKYFIKRKAVPSSAQSYELQTALKLWQVSVDLTAGDRH